MSKKVIVAGASGLIGSALVNILLKQPEYNEVILLVRKELPLNDKKLKQVVINFDQLDKYIDVIEGHALFCCLGSTKKKTPDLALYRKTDHDYPVKLAELCKQNGVRQYHLVSALGANARSSNFYTKMKGETEEAIKNIGLKCLHIYEPSLLTGDRKEYRPAERMATIMMRIIDPLLIGGLKKYRSIPAETVAKAMAKQSLINTDGVFIHPSDQIKQIA